MGAYIVRRLLLLIPTLFGIMLLNFIIVQAAPGGPVEQIIAQIQGLDVEATARGRAVRPGAQVPRPAPSRPEGIAVPRVSIPSSSPSWNGSLVSTSRLTNAFS
jgi:hypothetical protein